MISNQGRVARFVFLWMLLSFFGCVHSKYDAGSRELRNSIEEEGVTTDLDHACNARASPSQMEDDAKKLAEFVEKHQRKLRRLLDVSDIGTVYIETYWHTITDGDEGLLSQNTIDKAMDVVNAAFSPYFNFTLLNQTVTDNPEYFNEDGMQSSLRKGDKATLNIYSSKARNYLGYATFPHEVSDDLGNDGVVIDYKTVPDGPYVSFSEGDTLVHEIGHWLGLYHTFQGGCGDGEGDYVEDTPRHANPDFSCDVGDACSESETSPIENYMNYTPDGCMNKFTTGQFIRMFTEYSLYRDATILECETGESGFMVDIFTNGDIGETSWKLTDGCTGTELLHHKVNYTKNYASYQLHECIPESKYTFEISNVHVDHYTVTIEDEETEGEPIDSTQSKQFGDAYVCPSKSPTSSPTDSFSPKNNEFQGTTAGAFGDPHIKTWSGELYDFHGVCDLVLLSNPNYKDGVGMNIHIRNKKIRQWSYVVSSAVRIGGDVLEVMGGNFANRYWVNGKEGEQLNLSYAILPETPSGLIIEYTEMSGKSRNFLIHLDHHDNDSDEGNIALTTWNAFVKVTVNPGSHKGNFIDSIGLMGSFPRGNKLGRDGVTVVADNDSFGQHWQVRPSDLNLFHSIEGPQYPSHCDIPSSLEMRRRLADNTVSLADARKVCSQVNIEDHEACVFDVIATNDEDSVGAYRY